LSIHDAAIVSLATVVVIVVIRFFAPLAAICSSDRHSPWYRCLAGGAYGGIVLLAVEYSHFDARGFALTLALLTASSVVIFVIGRFTTNRFIAVLSSFAAFLVLPRMVLPVHDTALMLGWDLALSAVSYTADRPERRTFGDYLFFLFVDPVYVYSQRSPLHSARVLLGPGLKRMAAGTVSLFAATLLLNARQVQTPLSSVVEPLLVAGSFYFGHLGLASLQIGSAMQAGCSPPERYLRPLSAISPRDFWLRWNTYMGAWARAYLYVPAVRFLLKRRMSFRSLTGAVALVGTFLAVGALHDIFSALSHSRLSGRWVIWFLANGVIVIVWEAVVGQLRSRALQSRAFLVTARMTFLTLAMGMAQCV
jgi:hypothetical protein